VKNVKPQVGDFFLTHTIYKSRMNVHYTGVTVYNVGSRDFLKFFTQWARILNQHFTHLPINL